MNVENLSYKIGTKTLIDDLSFSIKEKSLNAFLTSNNSCKTTLIKTLGDILYVENGKISVNGIRLNKDNFRKYIVSISTVFEDVDNQFICDTVEEEIKCSLVNLKYLRKDINRQYNYVVDLLKIKGITKKKINSLSYYEKVKVLLAASIIHKPKVLLVDDVLRFLDSKEKKEIIRLFYSIIDNLNISILFTTSNLSDVDGLDNIYVLNEGKIVMHDSFENIILNDNELSKIGIEVPLMIDLSRKLEFYGLIDKIYYDRDKVVDKLWK